MAVKPSRFASHRTLWQGALLPSAIVALSLLSACAAGRGTYFLGQTIEPVTTARDSGAPESAVYAWTLADEFRRKAWEEWSSSDYEEAERLSQLAVEWAQKADQLARSGGAVQILDEQPTMDAVRAAIRQMEGAATPADEPQDATEGDDQ